MVTNQEADLGFVMDNGSRQQLAEKWSPCWDYYYWVLIPFHKSLLHHIWNIVKKYALKKALG